ncbi:FHA domain-containing protein [Aliiroseovarius sp. F20344]|uniref:FHA domain-containing protein n=1 Tax=Aliiroseovarius sp. F20344 TaxID=2926414 RepID=UPI001FF27A50|nr:FHA domain-containing protein [Aliiroseovarius sp. F20344]MCK0141497.1 FHA domain-containing protein [Aliiroseovarius sp. F20344]
MFKYKSPLSRLLEGSAKKADKDEAHEEEERDEAAEEPIADLTALRQVLAGGNQASEVEAELEVPAEEEIQIEEINVDDIAPIEVSEEAEQPTPVMTEDADEAVMSEVVKTVQTDDLPDAGSDIALTEAPEADEEPEVTAAPAPSSDRSDRVKTTFLGFERPENPVQDSMEADPVAKQVVATNTFPVGWLVITDGPGRGTSFSLVEGLAQIGRNDDQAVQLDFGDNGISRAGHAVVAYNSEDQTCYLGHGGKANLVRLNGGPVLSTVPLSTGDKIRISDTTLRFVSFCDENFDWQNG